MNSTICAIYCLAYSSRCTTPHSSPLPHLLRLPLSLISIQSNTNLMYSHCTSIHPHSTLHPMPSYYPRTTSTHIHPTPHRPSPQPRLITQVQSGPLTATPISLDSTKTKELFFSTHCWLKKFPLVKLC